jgi:tRNA dimethylallyltransferase
MRLLAIFGPTAVGKTSVAIAAAEILRADGEDPIAISCDSIQVYRGLEVLSGAASEAEREQLEHRLLSFVDIGEEYSAGRFADAAQPLIDEMLEQGRRPILVGGTGLYLRAAVSELELRPPVDPEIRAAVAAEAEERGLKALHAEIEPAAAAGIAPGDSTRVLRAIELQRAGHSPAPAHEQGGELWTARPRHPTLLAGLTLDREELDRRISERVDRMLASGAAVEAAAAVAAGASRTARAALGFEALLAADAERVKTAHRRFARRQLTWMRRMEGVTLIDRTGRSAEDVAEELVGQLRAA